jgi:predicted permease
MSAEWKFGLTILLIAAATAGGWLCRRTGLLREELARPMMTALAVGGYAPVGFLAIWGIRVTAMDVWLPVLGFVQYAMLALLGVAVAGKLLPTLQGRGEADEVRQDVGMFGCACGFGNHGFTMAGFVVYLLAGDEGLGHSTIYAMYTFFALVVVSYSIARHYAGHVDRGTGLGKLLLGSVFNWRSVSMPVFITAIVLSAAGVPRPTWVAESGIIDWLMAGLIGVAYFVIGLRLHLSDLGHTVRLLGLLVVMRHGVALLLGVGLVWAASLTPWGPTGVNRMILLIQSSVPMAVLNVSVANMFHLSPRKASTLFVLNSALYLAFGVPVILGIWG